MTLPMSTTEQILRRVEYRTAFAEVVESCPDPYARTYATQGVCMAVNGNPLEALHAQALYVLSNTAYWRGDQAKFTKKLLRDLIGN